MITAPAEKKQLASVSQAYEVLSQQTSRGELAPETLQKVNGLVDALSNRNFPAASQIQAVGLDVKSHWLIAGVDW